MALPEYTDPLAEYVSGFERRRVLVIGDAIVDEYLTGECSRISPEAPVPVLRVHSVRRVLGGAANTAANVVSLLSATVLYIFATGVVKGFGFALGLSTLIDLAILFWFTKPLVTVLARRKFFNGGGELSGLSASTLGIDRVATSGGKA